MAISTRRRGGEGILDWDVSFEGDDVSEEEEEEDDDDDEEGGRSAATGGAEMLPVIVVTPARGRGGRVCDRHEEMNSVNFFLHR